MPRRVPGAQPRRHQDLALRRGIGVAAADLAERRIREAARGVPRSGQQQRGEGGRPHLVEVGRDRVVETERLRRLAEHRSGTGRQESEGHAFLHPARPQHPPRQRRPRLPGAERGARHRRRHRQGHRRHLVKAADAQHLLHQVAFRLHLGAALCRRARPVGRQFRRLREVDRRRHVVAPGRNGYRHPLRAPPLHAEAEPLQDAHCLRPAAHSRRRARPSARSARRRSAANPVPRPPPPPRSPRPCRRRDPASAASPPPAPAASAPGRCPARSASARRSGCHAAAPTAPPAPDRTARTR